MIILSSKVSIMAVLFLLFFSACGSDNTISPAVAYCNDRNGSVITDISTGENLCQYEVTYDYDSAEEQYTFSCNLQNFYEDKECKDIEDDVYISPLHITSSKQTIGETFYQTVIDILSKLNHTGYTHRTNGPFVLHPSYTELIQTNELDEKELNSSIKSYNLFLDCSGFVGYYVLQGISKKLYSEVTTCYNSSRPLAADFADTFRDAKYKTTDENVSDALFSNLNNSSNSVEWGRVPNMKDAKVGDIIVYKHSKNIIHNGKCDNIVKPHKNTGHVLFIMSKPERRGSEWLVKVADSTTAPHSYDSRRITKYDNKVFEQSYYQNSDEVQSNHYTAWSKRYDNDFLELCDTESNNTFHRRCTDFGLKKSLRIDIQTKNIYSPTGIGIGNIYISDDMLHYRVREHAQKSDADIYIGRAIIYKELFLFKGEEYATVVSPDTNRTWLDRNLGASRSCSSFYDNKCIGDYYQWGREADGHQESNSTVQAEQVTALTMVGDKFVTYFRDWTTLDENGSLRSSFLKDSNSGKICPKGFRVPSMDELEAEFDMNNSIKDNFLNISVAGGYRDLNGSFSELNESITLRSYNVGSFKRSVNSLNIVYDKQYNVGGAMKTTGRPGFGYNIRCIKE